MKLLSNIRTMPARIGMTVGCLVAATTAGAQAPVAPVDRLVRTVKQGEIPMLDDVSLVALTGGDATTALAVRQGALTQTGGFWVRATDIGRSSLPEYRDMNAAGFRRRADVLQVQLQETRTFWLPLALTDVVLNGDSTVNFPVTIDPARFTLGDKASHVCAYGRQACIQLDNVTVQQTIYRANVSHPDAALRAHTTLMKASALPVFGLVIEVLPGVKKVDGRSIIRAQAVRGSYIDLTQCTQAIACASQIEFDLTNGAGMPGWFK